MNVLWSLFLDTLVSLALHSVLRVSASVFIGSKKSGLGFDRISACPTTLLTLSSSILVFGNILQTLWLRKHSYV